jgi:glutamate--cysteine ligase
MTAPRRASGTANADPVAPADEIPDEVIKSAIPMMTKAPVLCGAALPMPPVMTSDPGDVFARRLAMLASGPHRALLAGGRRGIEKESLRVTREGALAMTPHPRAFGSALTHSQLTTDYSEALLEVITPAEKDVPSVIGRLDALHRLVAATLGAGELLWPSSMPCPLPADEQIPIARYGTSNIGRLKHVYRQGLALRYGRAMQCIAGIHYNWSPDAGLWQVLAAGQGAAGDVGFQSEGYMATVRNFRRYSWLLLYLFGASPAMDAGFARGRIHGLQTLDPDTLYLPYATSLRMSDMGYQNAAAQGLITPRYDTLEDYVGSLARAVSQPYPHYQALGTRRGGEWVQINTNVLQIENEFYSTIRPKRVTRPGERPLQALLARGVEYVEVRCQDLDPFNPLGISAEDARFLDAFLLFCALEDSPALGAAEYGESNANFLTVAREGRRPGLTLSERGRAIPLQDSAAGLLSRIEAVAAALDAAAPDAATPLHAQSIATQRAKLMQPERTASARVLAALTGANTSFAEFSLDQARQHHAALTARPLDAASAAHFAAEAEASLREQQAMEENADAPDFDRYIAEYQRFTLSSLASQAV